MNQITMNCAMRRARRTSKVLGMLITAVLWQTGCALETGVEGEFDSKELELRCTGAATDPECPFKQWVPQVPKTPTTDIVHTGTPIICVKPTATPSTPANSPLLTISRDNQNRYRTLHWHSMPANTWGSYGTRQFVSKAACAFRENDASGRDGFVMAGKSTDGKIYASPGITAPISLSDQLNPTPVSGTPGQFAAVTSTVYPEDPNDVQDLGHPALGDNASGVLLVAMGEDRWIHAHVRRLPYVGGTWSARITGPQLPAGWVPIGAPAVVHAGVTFSILVHARNGSQDRLFQTWFYLSSSSQHFSSGIGSPASEWIQLPNMGRIDDGPVLTVHPDHGFTVYFRRYNPTTQTAQIMQTSSLGQLGQNPVMAIDASEGINFASGPAAAASTWVFETAAGKHHVLARTGTQLRRNITNLDTNIMP